jgi:hypothetical protein
MSASLDMTGSTQRAVAAWLTAQLPTWAALTPTWVPRILTGYQRATAGDALSQMEAGGEPDVIIVECQSADPDSPIEPTHWDAEVIVRVRHDCDRVPESVHSARVHALLTVIHDTEAAETLSAEDDYTAQILIPGRQYQSNSGRSFETSITFTVKGFPRTST